MKLATPTLTIVHRTDGWHVLTTDLHSLDCGPFTRRSDAVACRKGLLKFYRHQHKRGWVTSERR